MRVIYIYLLSPALIISSWGIIYESFNGKRAAVGIYGFCWAVCVKMLREITQKEDSIEQHKNAKRTNEISSHLIVLEQGTVTRVIDLHNVPYSC